MDHLEPTQPRASDESPKSGEHGKQDHDEPTMADTKQDEKTHDGVGIEEIPTEPSTLLFLLFFLLIPQYFRIWFCHHHYYLFNNHF